MALSLAGKWVVGMGLRQIPGGGIAFGAGVPWIWEA